MDALSISRAPIVWSYGSITRELSPSASAPVWRRRQLSLDTAKVIARKGGVVGLWSLTADMGKTIETYANGSATTMWHSELTSMGGGHSASCQDTATSVASSITGSAMVLTAHAYASSLLKTKSDTSRPPMR